MHQDHPNLSPEINAAIKESELQGGCELAKLPVGKRLIVQTRNTKYTITKRGPDDYLICGHAKYCPESTECHIAGSTWGGSMLKMGFVGRGMRLEFSVKEHGTVTTSTIQEIEEV